MRGQLEIGKLNWKKVATSDKVIIGELEGGEIDPSSWQLTHVHIGLNDEALKKFRLKKPFMGRILICLPVETIETVNEVVALNKSFEELKNTKECQEFSVK